MTLWMWGIGLAPSAGAAEHTVGLRLRHGWVPQGLIDRWFFDDDDPGALPYPRPPVRLTVIGLEYTLALADDGGPGFVFWAERIPIHLDPGYFDDREVPAIHDDGDWLAPDPDLGAWALGANFQQEIPLSPTAAPVWVGFVWSMGLGVGLRTGDIPYWHAGQNPLVVDPTCAPLAPAPDRATRCGPDGLLDIPAVVPILDISLGARVHLTDHATLRLEGGLHDVLYLGGSLGGTF